MRMDYLVILIIKNMSRERRNGQGDFGGERGGWSVPQTREHILLAVR
jgi:hypothetical protein